MPPSTKAIADETVDQAERERVLRDYRIAVESREASVIGRKEVLTGKAKFGIFGDGKEVPQLAMARSFRPGDFRSGYYRDQTFMLALGTLTLEEYFAQLYADPDLERDPCSGGRQMNAHFATRLVAPDGSWRPQTDTLNTSADLSPTGSQMPRLVGLAYASKLYRQLDELRDRAGYSRQGDEIAFGTIGDASCAEGLFWESVNAAGVLQVPMLLSIWDDGYGISVPNRFQITKGQLSKVLRGFERGEADPEGYDIYTVPGWDYRRLCQVYATAAEIVRREHVPAIVHVTELTQPQGHSTSGSQERYKPAARLEWEREHDCLRKMRQWILAEGIATAGELDELEGEAWQRTRGAQRAAWQAFRAPFDEERATLVGILGRLEVGGDAAPRLAALGQRLERQPAPLRRDLLAVASEALLLARHEEGAKRAELVAWKTRQEEEGRRRYGSHLYCEGPRSALAVAAVAPVYSDASPSLRGFEVLNACFDRLLSRHPHLVAFGEDVGRLGDVNQGFVGLQDKHGELRVSDTGIREATIVGQAIGLALRGLRPIAEIQYLDYVLYALQILADDLATLHWRTAGGQKAPVIIRTRGHRLEGVWHSGSPMASLVHLLRGMHICVPRDMTRAAGFYNTLLEADDPALVVEVLNGYRLKETLPDNLGELAVPLGVPEVLRAGDDLTVVTYGACCRVALEAAELLTETGIEAEVIDVQTLLPFDRPGRIAESVRKTSRVLFLDEDVPGGTNAYMMRQVLEEQAAFDWLDAAPRTVSGRPHRPAYGSDGDYFSKPCREEVFEAAYGLMHDSDPARFPLYFR